MSRYFYFFASLVMAGLVVWGFSHTVDANLLHANPPRPLLLWFHGSVFSAWIVLFIAQSALVRVRKVSIQRVLGWFGSPLAVTVVVSGFIVSVVMLRFDITVLHRRRLRRSYRFSGATCSSSVRAWRWRSIFGSGLSITAV